ncbi:MAG TPA: SMP-30/gluconolactonase/LRE family protein [Solirubrobacteraceae bacterium]|nr:SMP-30/gluconolactonase/LRE family protein [Solirubrobacteraceae bacterium]
MAVELKSETLAELIDPRAEVERLATGFVFTEGPLWNKEGGFLLFSDMPGDVRRRWSEREGVVELRRPNNKGNGMVYDAAGNLLVCEHVTSSLVRERPDGVRETLAFHYQGRYLNSPNDVITRSDGTIYFTDPAYGRVAHFGIPREQELSFQGVYMIPAGGGDPRLVVGEDEFAQPNGLCFAPGEKQMYINDTERALIRSYDVQSDGTLTGGRVFFAGIGSGVIEEGIPDGMKVDERGNVWVTGPRGVWVISSDGEHLGIIEVPENVGNLAWGGPEWKVLYVPSSTSLYRVATKVASSHLPYH